MKQFFSTLLFLYFFIYPLSLNAGDKSISISDLTLAEGNDIANATTFTFTVTSEDNTNANDTVKYMIYHGSADNNIFITDANDFNSTDMNGIAEFLGNKTANIDVLINADLDSEANEIFTIVLYDLNISSNGYWIKDGTAIGTITNDDTQTSPPIMGNIPNQSTLTTIPYSLNLSSYVSEPDNDAVLLYTLMDLDTNATFIPPDGLTFTPSTGILTGTPSIAGAYNLGAFATDDDGNSTIANFTLTIEESTDLFCYGYSYKQLGWDFTADNNGTEAPTLTGSVDTAWPINMSIYIKNKSTYDVSDLNVTIFKDTNTSQVEYIPGTTTFVGAGSTQVINVADSGVADEIAFIEVGPVQNSEYVFIFYDLNPNNHILAEPIDINLTFHNITQSLGGDIKMCSAIGSGGDYNATKKIFNVEHARYAGAKIYNLPTQIVRRADNFKVVAYDIDDPDERASYTGGVWVELINIGTLESADADCNNPNSSISAEIKAYFDNNSTFADFNAAVIANDAQAGITSADFYKNANENTAFRISYPVIGEDGAILESQQEANGELTILNFTDLASGIATYNAGLGLRPNEQNKCYQPVWDGNHRYDTMPEACGNDAESNPISQEQYAICLECIQGYNMRYACSRDNFAIRPEAFMIKINDKNTTNEVIVADDISGVDSATVPTTTEVNLASGYDYKLGFTATSSTDNAPTFGYTTSLTTKYTWDPRTGTPTGCDESNRTIPQIDFDHGYISIETNTSMNQVGKYKLSLIDTSWTLVDQNASHHVGAYYDSSSNADCVLNSSGVEDIGLATASNGCNISSSHINTDSNLAYRDYNLTFHPYRFDLNTTTKPMAATIGLGTTPVTGTTSFVYMSDMNTSEEMSYHLNGYITAQGFNDSNLTNFTDGCYAKAVDLNITKSSINTLNLPFQYKFEARNISDANITTPVLGDIDNTAGPITIGTTAFHSSIKGSMNSNLNLNFFREVNSSVNPQQIQFGKMTVDCNDAPNNCTFNADLVPNKTTHGEINVHTLNSDNNITYLYGRTHAPTYRFKGPTGDAFIYYESFCNGTDKTTTACAKTLLPNGTGSASLDDPRWFKNTFHTVTTYGDVGTVSQKGTAGTISVVGQVNATGQTTAPLIYNETKGYPYKTTMENNASRWLIYNKYDSTDTTNEFDVGFVNIGDWTGKKETDVTSKKNSSAITNRRSMW